MKCRCVTDFIAVVVVVAAAGGLIVFAIAMQNSSRRVERKLAAHENNLTKITERLMLIGTTTTKATTTTTTTTMKTNSKLSTASSISTDTTEAGSFVNIIPIEVASKRANAINKPIAMEAYVVTEAYEQPRISSTSVMNPTAAVVTTTPAANDGLATIPAYITADANDADVDVVVIPNASTRIITRLRTKPVARAIAAAAARATTNALEVMLKSG